MEPLNGKKRVGLLALALWLLAARPAAQAAPLTWQECIQEAARNNPDLSAAQESSRKARAQYDASATAFFPQLSAQADVIRAKDSSNDQNSVGLSARQPLFTGGKNRANLEKSKADWDAAEAALAVVRPQVSFDLRSAFAQLLYVQQQMELAESIAGRRQENVRLVELRYEAGRENKGSFLRSRASYLQADFEVAQAGRALRVAQRQLAKVLHRDEIDQITVVGDFDVTAPANPPDFRVLAKQTPVRLQAEAQARSSEAGVGVARSELFPEVDAVAGVQRAGSTWPPNRDSWSGGLTLTFPFWPGGRNFFDVKAAEAEARRGRASAQSVYDQTVLGLEQTFADYQDAIQRMGVQREFLAAAETRAEIARSQYTAGLLSFQDWDLIENDLISNQKTMLTDMRDAVITDAAWERAGGRGEI